MTKEYYFTKGRLPFYYFYYGKIIEVRKGNEGRSYIIDGANWDKNAGLDFGEFPVPEMHKNQSFMIDQYDVDKDVAQHQTIRYILGEIK